MARDRRRRWQVSLIMRDAERVTKIYDTLDEANAAIKHLLDFSEMPEPHPYVNPAFDEENTDNYTIWRAQDEQQRTWFSVQRKSLWTR